MGKNKRFSNDGTTIIDEDYRNYSIDEVLETLHHVLNTCNAAHTKRLNYIGEGSSADESVRVTEYKAHTDFLLKLDDCFTFIDDVRHYGINKKPVEKKK